MNEVRRSVDSPKSESMAKPTWSKKHCRDTGRMGWLETEWLKAFGHEPRRPVLVLNRSKTGVRVPVVAEKRLITVEPRGAGK